MGHDTVAAQVERIKTEVERVKVAFAISQNEVARRCGVDRSVFSRWLNARFPSSVNEIKWAAYWSRVRRHVEAREQSLKAS